MGLASLISENSKIKKVKALKWLDPLLLHLN